MWTDLADANMICNFVVSKQRHTWQLQSFSLRPHRGMTTAFMPVHTWNDALLVQLVHK